MRFDAIMSFFSSADFSKEVNEMFSTIKQFVVSLNLSDSFLHDLKILLDRYPDSQLEIKMNYSDKRRIYSVIDTHGIILLFNQNHSLET